MKKHYLLAHYIVSFRTSGSTRAPRLTLIRKVIRDSVQSSAGLLKVHIFRCFQKISLILCNSDIIFRITFIIKLQTSCGALVTRLSFSSSTNHIKTSENAVFEINVMAEIEVKVVGKGTLI